MSEITHPHIPCKVHLASGKPSCTAWFFALNDQWPDHVCEGVMRWSTLEFAQARVTGDNQHDDVSDYHYTWPLPVGYKALRDWHYSRRWIHKTERELGAVLTELLHSGEFSGAPEFPYWLTPPLRPNDDRAWIAFAAGRFPDGSPWSSRNEEARILREHSPYAGRMWFLGLVRKFSDALVGPLEWPPGVKGTITVDTEYDSEEIISGETAKTYSERVKVSAAGVSVSYGTAWRFTEPAVLIEAYPTKPGELAALTSEADKLLKWYNATLLGKEFKTRGGRSRDFSTPADFIAELIRVLEEWHLRGSANITKQKVARRMRSRFSPEVSERSVTNYLQRLGLTWSKARDLDFLRSYTPPADWPE